jgi:hypothetical protein
MGILSITTSLVGQTGGLIGGVVPRQVSMITTDNLATVTTAGYLNEATLQGYNIFNTDIINMWYGATGGFSGITSPGTFSQFTASISNGVISLVQIVNPGDVLLPVVSGDLASFNGTTGQIADSGITAASVSSAVSSNGLINTISVTMTPAQVTGAYAAPVVLLAAAAGKAYIVLNAAIYTASTGNTPYAGGGVAIVQYAATVHGAGTDALGATIPAAEITAAASQIYNLSGLASATVSTGITNVGLYFSNATGPFTGGTGTNITITLQVMTLTATV